LYKNLDKSFYRFVTIHTFDRRTDRQTDGQTEFSSLDRICIPYSAEITWWKCFSWHWQHWQWRNIFFIL